LYIPILRYLEAAGARGVAFDILFSEASVHGVEEDRQLAVAFGSALPVISTIAPGFDGAKDSGESESMRIFRERMEREDRATQFSARYLSHDNAVRFRSGILPVPEIMRASSSFGSAWAIPDRDGVFRHYWPGGYLNDIPF